MMRFLSIFFCLMFVSVAFSQKQKIVFANDTLYLGEGEKIESQTGNSHQGEVKLKDEFAIKEVCVQQGRICQIVSTSLEGQLIAIHENMSPSQSVDIAFFHNGRPMFRAEYVSDTIFFRSFYSNGNLESEGRFYNPFRKKLDYSAYVNIVTEEIDKYIIDTHIDFIPVGAWKYYDMVDQTVQEYHIRGIKEMTFGQVRN